jgi:hypothetical protein
VNWRKIEKIEKRARKSSMLTSAFASCSNVHHVIYITEYGKATNKTLNTEI